MADGLISPAHEADVRITVYTRVGCHLCTDAIEVVQRVAGELGVNYSEVDIDSEPGLVAQFSEYVPVVEVDGVQQGFWRIDETRLRRALAAGKN